MVMKVQICQGRANYPWSYFTGGRSSIDNAIILIRISTLCSLLPVHGAAPAEPKTVRL